MPGESAVYEMETVSVSGGKGFVGFGVSQTIRGGGCERSSAYAVRETCSDVLGENQYPSSRPSVSTRMLEPIRSAFRLNSFSVKESSERSVANQRRPLGSS